MNRYLSMMRTLALMIMLIHPGLSYAQDEPAPQSDPAEESEGAGEVDEEEQAAKHFATGRKLYVEGKYLEAISELLQAYELRPAPPILLNIARTYEKLDDKRNALKYYKEYLLKARVNDPSRGDVEKVVKELEKQVQGQTGAVTSAEGTDTPSAAVTEGGELTSAAGHKQHLIHTPVDMAKVNQSVTIMAELPPQVEADAMLVYFRKAGEVRFQMLKMEVQGDAYVTQIPAKFMTSTSLQYYIEATFGPKHQAVAAAGSKETPNIIVIEGGHAPRMGPIDFSGIHSPYRTWFWVATSLTAAFVAGTVSFGLLARDRQSAMESWVEKQSCDALCQQGKREPVQPFNIKARDWESEGQLFATLGKVFFAATLVSAGAAATLFYYDRRYVGEERRKLMAKDNSIRWAGSPWVSQGGMGFWGRIEF